MRKVGYSLSFVLAISAISMITGCETPPPDTAPPADKKPRSMTIPAEDGKKPAAETPAPK